MYLVCSPIWLGRAQISLWESWSWKQEIRTVTVHSNICHWQSSFPSISFDKNHCTAISQYALMRLVTYEQISVLLPLWDVRYCLWWTHTCFIFHPSVPLEFLECFSPPTGPALRILMGPLTRTDRKLQEWMMNWTLLLRRRFNRVYFCTWTIFFF